MTDDGRHLKLENGQGGEAQERQCKILSRLGIDRSGVPRTHISILLIWQRRSSGLLQLGLVLVHQSRVDLDLGRRQSWGSDELERLVADELACEPQERLLEVVVGLGRDLEVLQVLLAVERYGSSLDFALLDVNLVTAQDDGNRLAHTLD